MMEILEIIKELLTNTKGFLEEFVKVNGLWIYGLLFLIVFCETGLVVLPLLPGDSLLFTAGVLAGNANNNLDVSIIILLLITAALLGDNTNYFIGKFLAKKGEGAKLFGIFTIKKEYIRKTEEFYEKHGTVAIIIARFVPIVRTFAPFVAGVGSMKYSKYITYCIIGAILWVTSITLAGYFLGSNPWVQKNFEKVVFGIIILSVLPVIFQVIKHRFAKK
ncbi:MAG: VTT domain-containing protein [Sphingobacteriales bacterium]|jgi:membrane-associated protein|nr:VTT domain-containing protein [Sphingobacteriales bacterium]